MNGNKVTLHRSDDSGTTYGTKIGDIVGVEPGEDVSETVDSTEHGATDDYRTYDYGLSDGGEWNLTVRYRASQTDIEALVSAKANGTKEYVQVQFPAPISKTKSFRCLVTKVGLAVPIAGQIDRMLTLKVDGAPIDAVLA
jgi:hypothetical protein